jgi:hypothetical protein
VIRYDTNWMGPISMDWINKHGEHWAGGRIDIYGPWPCPKEYALPVMHREDFYRFGQWLEKLETKRCWGFKRIIKEYERNNSKIRWFKNTNL